MADYRVISPAYFRAMGIAILMGREFTSQDNLDGAKVVIINEALARKYLPSEDPLGKQIVVRNKQLEIVGVVGNLKHENLTAEDATEIYVPYLQSDPPPWSFLVVRSAVNPQQLVASIGTAVGGADPDVPVYSIRTMEERLSNSFATQRFNGFLFVIFGALSLILAAVGIYGVINYVVSQRAEEIGIRIALGAQRNNILKLVLVQGTIYVGIGIVVGLAGAIALTSLISNLLYGVKPNDPIIYTSASLILAGVALIATLIPARRAIKIDPLRAIKEE